MGLPIEKCFLASNQCCFYSAAYQSVQQAYSHYYYYANFKKYKLFGKVESAAALSELLIEQNEEVGH